MKRRLLTIFSVLATAQMAITAEYISDPDDNEIINMTASLGCVGGGADVNGQYTIDIVEEVGNGGYVDKGSAAVTVQTNGNWTGTIDPGGLGPSEDYLVRLIKHTNMGSDETVVDTVNVTTQGMGS